MALSERDLWIRDISHLRRLGNTQMQRVADDVNQRLQEIGSYSLDGAAFGELYQLEQKIQRTYENVRSVLYAKLRDTHEGLQDTATGLVRIADHYAGLEQRMSK